jgi:hypothetical protein
MPEATCVTPVSLLGFFLALRAHRPPFGERLPPASINHITEERKPIGISMEAEATRYVLMYFIMPLWLLAAFADWLCHRASDIEHTSGPKETLIHIALFTEMAVPIVLVMHFDVTALVIATMILFWVLHEATAVYDVMFAVDHREVTPLEQWVHSYLGVIPLLSFVLVATLNWSLFLALFGTGTEPARFEFAWKRPQLPIWYHAGVLLGTLLLVVLPYAEELRRGLRVTKGRLITPSEHSSASKL